MYPSRVTTTHMVAPANSGKGHYCGTEEDFREGAVFDPDLHVEYRNNGLPKCCPGDPEGGVGLGGRSYVYAQGAGGVGMRGRCVYRYSQVYAAFYSTHGIAVFGDVGGVGDGWANGFGWATLHGPSITGVPGRWEFSTDGSTFAPYFTTGPWRVDNWNGYGEVTMTEVSPGNTPTTLQIRGEPGWYPL